MINMQPDWAAEEWKKWALCAEVGGDFWFPAEKCQPLPMIRELCADCPVNAECLSYAIDNRLDHGIWAGTTPKQRERLRSARRRERQLGEAA